MISSQCNKRHTSVNSFVFVIMIVAKILLLFPPLLLLANAQGGGRLGFFARPDFRRPRPWDRPTVPPVPDTPMPTERVTERITEPPKARTELTTITPVRTTSPPVPSVSRLSPRGRVWARPVFGPRPTPVSTPAAITPIESITIKAEDYSPVVSVASSTTEFNGYTITPSTRFPFVDNHVKYNDPNNYNPRGRYSPKLTHNADEIPSDSIKVTSELPSTTEKIAEFITEKVTPPAEDHSEMVSSPSTTTESVISTMAPTTGTPFIDKHIKDNEFLNSNLGTRSPQTSPHLIDQTTELRTTPEPLTTPRVSIIPTRATNLNSRSRFPPYMSHNLNVPTPGVRPQSIPDDYLKISTTIAATTESPSSTTESAGYTIPSSRNVPFVDEHKQFDDTYLTSKTAVPFKIISTTEVASASTNRHDPMYQDPMYQNNENIITSDYKLSVTTTPKALVTSKQPEEYITPATSKVPFIAVHKEYDVGSTSQPSVEYTNGYEKTSEVPPKSDDYDAPIYPVYHHDNEKVNHYEQSSPATREPQRYIITTTKLPFIDMQKLYDGSTAASPVEYTNGHDKTTEILSNSGYSDEFVENIYQNKNHYENNYEHSSTPKIITTTQSALAYQYRHPITTTERAALTTQTIRHTNNYRYNDPTTKPTTRYTTTTLRSSRVNKIYDIDNFQCKDEDGYYSITNQCDDFIECKSGFPIQNTCPDGLHFNPAAKYSEFPCAYPSEVKCESNSVIRQPEPTSECPRRYGYFTLQNGSCDKYVMCQEGQATIMSCPPGLAFSVATSSCDWPANVPDCLPDVFQGFTCPAPELNEDGQPTHSIYKYRYDKSCKKYIACQKGHPRLLSCDSGLAFDENSESCIDEFDVSDCT